MSAITKEEFIKAWTTNLKIAEQMSIFMLNNALKDESEPFNEEIARDALAYVDENDGLVVKSYPEFDYFIEKYKDSNADFYRDIGCQEMGVYSSKEEVNRCFELITARDLMNIDDFFSN